MISWRYHVVSIVAVILAFGLGILAGSSVVNERFVRDLQKNYDEVILERDAALETIAVYEQLAEDLQPTLRDDRLLGEEAVVVTMEGVQGPARRAVDELTAAGVDVLATLEVTRLLTEPDAPGTVEILQEVLASSATDPEALRDHATDGLAVRLAGGPDDQRGGQGDDVLARLLDEGLVTADRDLDGDALLGLGGAGQLVILAAGGPAPEALPDPEAFMLPLAERLVRLGADVAAVGPREDPYGFVAAVRDAGDVPDCSLVTIDDIDLTIGGIALVMGIERLLEDGDPEMRPGGDYGLDGEAIVPGGDPPGSCRR